VTGVAAFVPRMIALDSARWGDWYGWRRWQDDVYWMRGQAYRRGGWR
jgi:hypothetical protein